MLISNRQGQEGQPDHNHVDHTAEKGSVFEFHCGQVHEPVSIKEAAQFP